MKKILTLILTLIVMVILVVHTCLVINAPDKGVVTGKIWTQNIRYLVIENDKQSGLVWVSWSVYFDAENGDIYDTECDCIVEQP